jgi:hypothetical protein
MRPHYILLQHESCFKNPQSFICLLQNQLGGRIVPNNQSSSEYWLRQQPQHIVHKFTL